VELVNVPLLTGIKATNQAEFARSLPRNLEPVALDTKISKGQFRAPAGAVSFGSGPGVDRGGIDWNGVLYRVMGTSLCRVSSMGVVATIGDVGPGGPVAMDYSFDRLGINSGDRLYYYDGITLTQVTDIDLGKVIDYMWIDGYHMTTDGTYTIVPELSDPTSVKPLKYGSAESDPDMVKGLIKFRGEAYILGRYTIEVQQNVGGNGYPFAVVKGATIPFGCVSPQAKALFAESFAFVGSGRNEPLGIYVAGQGTAEKISTREIDDILASVKDAESIVLEARSGRDESRLFVHLPDKSLVYLLRASQRTQEPVWYEASSGFDQEYRPRFSVFCYGKFIAGDTRSNRLCVISDDVSTHFDEPVNWQFDVGLLYNDTQGAIVHSVELSAATGCAPFGERPTMFMSMTRDGVNYSIERPISMGRAGQRDARLKWFPKTRFRNYMGLRFRGFNKAMPGFSACVAGVSPLSA
jgi:hypothetical protein